MKLLITTCVAVLFTSLQVRAETFQFTWNAVVNGTYNEFYSPTTIPGINVGDQMVATITYDPLAFGPGTLLSGIGRRYAAPLGLTIDYDFTSGASFSKPVLSVSAFDYTFDQVNWEDPDQLILFQGNDYSSALFTTVPPASFDQMHDILRNNIPLWDTAVGSAVFFENYYVDVSNPSISISAVPEPAGSALLLAGLVALYAARRPVKSQAIIATTLSTFSAPPPAISSPPNT